ncbi:MAG: hypothetical protein OEY01_07575 [Desulfobulbaceae bacterium]|nr:hypothetical protein [Desulfobulbaceae bacterium]HIJ78914.1 hypothetical protein [Deltaproteobacteria bacterium]
MKWLIGLFIFLASGSSVMGQEVVSGWDDPAAGLAGWEKGSSITFTEYHDSGGNPGGHVRAYGNLTTGLLNKQPEFTGNYIEKNYNNISLDIMVNLQQLPNFKPAITLRYSPSFAGWNYELADFTINAGVWQHFEVYFDPAWSDAEAQAHGWSLSPGPTKSFQETLAHVWAVSVTSPYPQITSKNLGYDNFKLSHAAPPPAAPATESQGQEGESTEEAEQPVKTIPGVRRPMRLLKDRIK